MKKPLAITMLLVALPILAALGYQLRGNPDHQAKNLLDAAATRLLATPTSQWTDSSEIGISEVSTAHAAGELVTVPAVPYESLVREACNRVGETVVVDHRAARVVLATDKAGDPRRYLIYTK